jgi:hypothetical protein
MPTERDLQAYTEGFMDGFIAMAKLHVRQPGSFNEYAEARDKYLDTKEQCNGTD